jgi:hypothetical protein
MGYPQSQSIGHFCVCKPFFVEFIVILYDVDPQHIWVTHNNLLIIDNKDTSLCLYHRGLDISCFTCFICLLLWKLVWMPTAMVSVYFIFCAYISNWIRSQYGIIVLGNQSHVCY